MVLVRGNSNHIQLSFDIQLRREGPTELGLHGCIQKPPDPLPWSSSLQPALPVFGWQLGVPKQKQQSG